MSILVIAPHADDEILGVGGTMIKAIANHEDVSVCIVTRAAEPVFSEDVFRRIRQETLECHKFLGVKKTFFLEFPAVMLETAKRYEINNSILAVVEEVKPDEVYIPHIGDMQKDHQIVTDAAMVALRPNGNHKVRRIYTYETLSETGWNLPNVQNEFIPNVYSDIGSFLDKKLEAMKIYASQLGEFPNPRSLGAIEALARYRGSTVQTMAAEAFALVREIK
ncbi:MAG: PIG-L family deacetylase [Oscillospiraceae bacterium]|nr:PIG-L family deacetylase [Oscillospiraceae bacterium]